MATSSSMGDMAQAFRTRLHNETVSQELSRLAQEMSSGRKSDISRTVRGDFTILSTVERGLRMAEIYTNSLAEAEIATGAQQDSLQLLHDKLADLAPTILSATASGQVSRLAGGAADTEAILAQAISAINTKVAGRSLFSGDLTDRSALVSAEEMMAALTAVVADAADGGEVIARVEAWFMSAGGGYETSAYSGGTGMPPQFVTGEGEVLRADLNALDPAIREGLMSLALSALAVRDIGPITEAAQSDILRKAGEYMLSSQDALSAVRAELGALQARVEETRVRQDSLTTRLQLEQARILAIDPFETATELEAVRNQLETLFMMTARLSRLSLAEYLR